MVNVVRASLASIDPNHRADYLDDVFQSQDAQCVPLGQIQPAIELVTAHLAQVIAAGVEEQALDQVACVFQAGRFTGTQAPVELNLGGGYSLGHRNFILLVGLEPLPEGAQVFVSEVQVPVFHHRIPVQGGLDVLMVLVGVHILE